MRGVSDAACVDLEAAYKLLLQQCGPCKKYLRHPGATARCSRWVIVREETSCCTDMYLQEGTLYGVYDLAKFESGAPFSADYEKHFFCRISAGGRSGCRDGVVRWATAAEAVAGRPSPLQGGAAGS